MSTNINITVGDNALLNAAKANQAGNRQAQLEREASKKLEAEATDARTKANAAAGKDANGNPLYGNPLYGVPSAAPNIDRRPAANRNPAESLLMRPSGPVVDAKLPLKSYGFPLFLSQASSDGSFLYSATGGPNNAPALIAPANPDGSGNSYYFTGEFPYVNSKSKFKQGIGDCTLEMFFKLGETFSTGQNQNPTYVFVGIRNGGAFLMDFQLGYFGGLRVCEVEISVVQSNANSNRVDIIRSSLPYDSPFGAGSWFHVALTKKIKSQPAIGSDFYFFVNGNLTASASVDWELTLFDGFSSGTWLELGAGTDSGLFPVRAQDVSVHGVRFLPKALYTANFTPPANL